MRNWILFEKQQYASIDGIHRSTCLFRYANVWSVYVYVHISYQQKFFVVVEIRRYGQKTKEQAKKKNKKDFFLFFLPFVTFIATENR